MNALLVLLGRATDMRNEEEEKREGEGEEGNEEGHCGELVWRRDMESRGFLSSMRKKP